MRKPTKGVPLSTTVIIHIFAKTGQRDAVLEQHHLLIQRHGDDPKLLRMDCYFPEDEPEQIVEIATWESKEAHQQWRQRVIDSGDADAYISLLAKPSSLLYLSPAK
ncbi:MAG TPA: hypothetical protein DCE42_11315 [Myxococcales bacterium]|nr:hypothetical protein [Myxococcales bacterium]